LCRAMDSTGLIYLAQCSTGADHKRVEVSHIGRSCNACRSFGRPHTYRSKLDVVKDGDSFGHLFLTHGRDRDEEIASLRSGMNSVAVAADAS